MDRLDGRVAVVTGAASGIGLAVTEAFLAEGMHVVMSDRDEASLSSQAARLQADGASVEAVRADVTDPDALDAVGHAAVTRFGRLHVAVNNAGIVNRGRTWELSLAEWHRIIDVDLWGVIHGIRAFVPRILETGDEGHVVNTASMAAVLPMQQLGPYSVAKHGVLALSDVLRAELDGLGVAVGVSVVMPGMIKTGMNPIGSHPPDAVARNIVDAIRARRAYVFTDHDAAEEVEHRLRAILDARADVLAP